MVQSRIDNEEWRRLIARLPDGDGRRLPEPDVAPSFDEPTARNRVGLVITRAVLGEPLYRLYRLYLGDPPPPRNL